MRNRPSLMIPQLSDDPAAPFPDPTFALDSPDGLLAWGGDLAPARLLNAYRSGIFPWYSDDQPILWWSPADRCVIEPANVHVSRRLGRLLRQDRFELRANTAFDQVVEGCALPRTDDSGTWITAEMKAAYLRLHELGVAHSIEVYLDGELAGGLYGLNIGRMFFAESMFSLRPNASKVALVRLCEHLARWEYPLLDCQVFNPHLLRMGAKVIERERYLEILAHGITQSPEFRNFGNDIA